MKITMAHGSGGQSTSALIKDVFAKYFKNDILDRMEDSAVVSGSSKIAVTTDSFVVTPLVFPGGDIGKLSVCGTVNDLLMSGATPKYITCGAVLEEGLDIELLDKIIASMAKTAEEAGVTVVTGDTKVIENRSKEPGLIINTSGIGFIDESRAEIGPFNLEDEDVLIITGNLGDHHATILGCRMGIENDIKSDCAPLVDIVKALFDNDIRVHAMRDVTRGGLGTVLNEFAQSSQCQLLIDEENLPVAPTVRDFCGLLGLDPIYMGNEGKAIISVHKDDADKALSVIRSAKYGRDATAIGKVIKNADTISDSNVILNTKLGGKRVIGLMYGEGLPRIC